MGGDGRSGTAIGTPWGGVSRGRGAAGQGGPRWEKRGRGHGTRGCLAQYLLAREGNSGDSLHTVRCWAEAPTALAHTRVLPCRADRALLCCSLAGPFPCGFVSGPGVGGCSPGVPGATAPSRRLGSSRRAVPLLGCLSRPGTVRAAPGDPQSAVLQARCDGHRFGGCSCQRGSGHPGLAAAACPHGHIATPGLLRPALLLPVRTTVRGAWPPRLLVLLKQKRFSGFVVVFPDVAVD